MQNRGPEYKMHTWYQLGPQASGKTEHVRIQAESELKPLLGRRPTDAQPPPACVGTLGRARLEGSRHGGKRGAGAASARVLGDTLIAGPPPGEPAVSAPPWLPATARSAFTHQSQGTPEMEGRPGLTHEHGLLASLASGTPAANQRRKKGPRPREVWVRTEESG